MAGDRRNVVMRESVALHGAGRGLLGAALALAFFVLGGAPSLVGAQDKDTPAKGKDGPAKGKEPKDKAPAVKLGLSINDPRSFQGYTLLAPLKGTKTFLLTMD